ncbi:BLUF domain-containing protein [Shewanella woodyi]|uniref:BLUF domain protein n=1 Tax=Shewanella woodyi (strain ATCC 51908 / MS32) TaxID=392500 RepID=B1KH49_SHEWM|nr:BLUF domain-containing protein [Shewanella woodyi]ACA88361.1 BLUF domain protein [Shewanella woodyi ATCC 51908]
MREGKQYMPIVQLIYSSSVSEGLSVMEIKALVEKAQINNRALSVTGFLCANSYYFLQCIEGESAVIDALFQKISKDSRHHSITVINKREVDNQQFRAWSMGAVLDIDRHMNIVDGFFPDGVFNPSLLSEQTSLEFIEQFSQIRIRTQERTIESLSK